MSPTMAELGLPQVGYNPDTWFGFFAPGANAARSCDLEAERRDQ